MQAAMAIKPRQRSDGAPDKRHRYVPPVDWSTQSLSALLDDTPRAPLAPKQMDWLKAVTPEGDGEAGSVFVAGDLSLLKQRCIAIIGSRKASAMGAQRARQLARQLVDRGIVVVSGLADGIDTEALTAAIDAGGKVIAVIGTPLDQAYPARNKELQELIYREHLLVSQFPSGTRTFPSNFPARNRTMAALSDASVVIEASDTSGTLHQAAECVRLGRWLGIAKSVIDDRALSWPERFASYDKFVPLENTAQLVARIYD